MENGLQHSGFDDPFQHCSLLALLPRTLGASFNPATIASETHELGSIQNLFNSMALKATTELLEQAHTISKSYSNLPILCSKDGNKASNPNGKDHPEGRRPALGRKRAQFSLKPMSSHVLPSIDHIEDPEEYFLAFEQREYAERELKKLRGEDMKALTQHHQSTTAARKRRPGLLGKTTSYKHHFPANADSVEAFLESQELPSTGILSPSKTSSGMELDTALHSETIDAPGSSRAEKTDGSAVDKEKNADNLSKILRSFEDLDEGEGRILLQETLQLKQIDVGKICLPELGSIQRTGGSLFNNKIAGGKSECPQCDQDTPSLSKSPLAAISTLQSRVSLKDPLEAFYSLPRTDASSSSRDSSQSKRTDGDSISLADTSYSNKSRLKGDDASSLVMQNGKRLNFEHEMQAPVLEADRTSGNKVILEEEFREHTSCLLDKNIDHNSSSHDTSKEVIRAVPDNRLQEKAPNSQDSSPSKSQDRDSVALAHAHANANESLIRDNASAPSLGTGKTSYIEDKMRSPVEAGRTTGGMITSEELTGQHCLLENYTNQNCRRGDNTNDLFSGLNGSLQEVRISQLEPLITGGPGAAVEDLIAGSSRTEHFSSSPSRKTGLHCSTSEINADTSLFGPDNNLQIEVNAWAQKRVATVEPSKETSCIPEVTTSVDGPLENTFVLAEESNEGHRTASGAPLSKGVTKKVPPHRRNKKKEFSRRQSLAGAGLEWKAGVRRSSRIRSRPLQYWLGERFLYGRIHDSLATVIGVKYASPAKEGKGPVLKVKSYVPEEYSDLVAQAALH